MADSTQLHVAVGVVVDAQNRICITQRPQGKHLAGLWEFPGGKVEDGESVEAALARELDEEIGISIGACAALTQIAHNYPEKSVLLDVLLVSAFTGVPVGREAQELRWVSLEALDDYQFPEANQDIIQALRKHFSPAENNL